MEARSSQREAEKVEHEKGVDDIHCLTLRVQIPDRDLEHLQATGDINE